MTFFDDLYLVAESLKPFQKATLPILAALAGWELIMWLRRPLSRRARLLRSIIWLTTALAIALPNLVQDVAKAVGIGRGTDVVLYFFVLAFLATSFYWYSRQLWLQRQMTELIRHVAIREARRGTDAAAADQSHFLPSE